MPRSRGSEQVLQGGWLLEKKDKLFVSLMYYPDTIPGRTFLRCHVFLRVISMTSWRVVRGNPSDGWFGGCQSDHLAKDVPDGEAQGCEGVRGVQDEASDSGNL